MKKSLLILFISFILIPLAIAKPLVYFSPYDPCDEIIIEYIDNANSHIEVAIYSFTLENIALALIRAHDRDVKVRVIMDKTQAGNKYSMDEKIEDAGILVIRDTHKGLMHNKFVILDSSIVITGSYNWSKNATEKNDENMIIFEEAAETYRRHFNYLWSRMAVDIVYNSENLPREYPLINQAVMKEIKQQLHIYINEDYGYSSENFSTIFEDNKLLLPRWYERRIKTEKKK